MKSFAPYLLHQLVRFGALTVPQMRILCAGRAKRSSLYRALTELVNTRCVIPALHPTKRIRTYAPTRTGVALALGRDKPRSVGIRLVDLQHAVMAAQAMIRLSQHSFVTGIATQYELEPEEVKLFTHNRIPDGILQLTREDQSFELAVEIETTLKSQARIEEVLGQYESTFRRGLGCAALIVVSSHPTIHEAYQLALSKLPKEAEEKVLLLLGPELRELNLKYFGSFSEGPAPAWDFMRTMSTGSARYVPLNSIGYDSWLTAKGPALKAESDFRAQEFL